MDAGKVPEIVTPSRPNDGAYVETTRSMVFRRNMSFSGYERDKLWINTGANGFADLSDFSGADSPNDGRGALAADFDDDGDVDLFVHNIQRERHMLYRNDLHAPGSTAAHFVKVRLRAVKSQHEAIGAVVVSKSAAGTTAQVIARGSGFASCQPPELVFGLGAATSTEIEVIWPGALRESFGTIAAGSRVLLVQGAQKPEKFAAVPHPLPDPLPQGLKLRPGDTMPNVRLVDRSGKESIVDVRALAGGKTLHVNLWATWCAACIGEIPALQKLAETDGQRVVAIGLDAPDRREHADKVLRERGGRFEAFYLPPGDEETTPDLSRIVDFDRLPLPTTLVIGPDGRLVSVVRGPVRAQ
ncbi:MAG: ASPIC/UnbV domain-containing protein [Planctomycetes bacterium]|nr:ASPIC/UnbV domain-containing protein [Planctomycetota bacterium]